MGSSRRRINLQISVDLVLGLALGITVLYLFLRGIPVQTGFFCDSEHLSYPYRPDTISTPVLIIAGFAASIFLVVITEVFNCIDRKCDSYCINREDLTYCAKGYGVFLVGFLVQEFIVETVKNQMGFLRPNFFDVCRPSYNRSVCPGYIHEYTCTGSEHGDEELRDIRQSFPSGHSAFSMYIAAFFTMYIERRLQIRFSRILKFLFQSGLVFTALMCGLSRISDHKHHPRDVIAGFLLGALTAVAVYKTLGKRTLISDKVFQTDDKDQGSSGNSYLCCACASSIASEPQTPAPLLQNEYLNSSGGPFSRPNSTNKFTNGSFNRRPVSTPVSPTKQFEDV